MKKTLLCIFLIIAMLLPVLSTPVFAASNFKLNIKSVTPGYDTASVSVQLTCSKKDRFLSYGVLYGTDTAMNERYVIKQNSGTKYLTSATTKNIKLENLKAGTAYSCCVYAVAADGTVYTGKMSSFTTKAYVGSFTVTTGDAASVKYNAATLHMTYTAEDGCRLSSRGFYYGTSADQMKKVTLSGKAVSKSVGNLTPETTYYYHSFVKARDGREFIGETKTFTTPCQFYGKIDVITGEAAKVEYKTATLNLSYSTEAPAKFSECGFYYGTSEEDMKKVKCAKDTTVKDIKGLKGNTAYIWYAYAAAKDGRIFVGETKTFTTLDPTVITGISLRHGDNLSTSSANSRTIYRYDAFQIETEITPASAKKTPLVWTVSDENIIVKNGSWIKAVNPGVATITATSPDGTVSDFIKVTVREETDWGPGPVITSVKAAGEDKISLKWKRPTTFWPDAKLLYEVYRAPAYEGPYERIEIVYGTSTTDDTALEPGTTYYYKVQAYEKNKRHYEFTDFSAIVSATTKEHVYVPKKDRTETTEKVESEVIQPNPGTGSEGSVTIPNNPGEILPNGTVPPVVSGLSGSYMIARGDPLKLTFTVADGLGDVVEKVTVKHNAVNTSTVSSLTNNRTGTFTCNFSISSPLFDKAGTYAFCAYARTTNFTCTDNCIGKFTVTVLETECPHTSVSEKTEVMYVNTVLTNAKHSFCESVTSRCNDCGADLGTAPSAVRTAAHAVNRKNGCCDCGYMDVSGYTPKSGYNQTGKTQNVFRTPYNTAWYGSVSAGEAVTVLGECGGCYLVEYFVAGGDIKQGYVPMNAIGFKPEAPADDAARTTYSIDIDSVYFYDNVSTGSDIYDTVSKKLLVEKRGNYCQVYIIDDSTGERVSCDNPDMEFRFINDIGVTIDRYGTLCLRRNGDSNLTELALYYKDTLQDSVRIFVCESSYRNNNFRSVTDGDEYWVDGFYLNDACKADNFDFAYSSSNWHFSMDFYNRSPMNFAVASFTQSGQLYDYQIVSGYWEDHSLVDCAIKGSVGTVELFTGDLINGTSSVYSKKTSVSLKVPKQGYVRTLYSGDSELVLASNVAELVLAYFDTVDDLKDLLKPIGVDSLSDCVDKKEFARRFLELLVEETDILEMMTKDFMKNSTEKVIAEVINVIYKENLVEEIIQLAADCITSVEFGGIVKGIAVNVENILLQKIPPAYAITNGTDFLISRIQTKTLVRHTAESMLIENTTNNIGFWIWYPKT